MYNSINCIYNQDSFLTVIIVIASSVIFSLLLFMGLSETKILQKLKEKLKNFIFWMNFYNKIFKEKDWFK